MPFTYPTGNDVAWRLPYSYVFMTEAARAIYCNTLQIETERQQGLIQGLYAQLVLAMSQTATARDEVHAMKLAWLKRRQSKTDSSCDSKK